MTDEPNTVSRVTVEIVSSKGVVRAEWQGDDLEADIDLRADFPDVPFSLSSSMQDRVVPPAEQAVGMQMTVKPHKASVSWSKVEAPSQWRYYLPMDCPQCDRHRLEYQTNAAGNVVMIRCEKCQWDSDASIR